PVRVGDGVPFHVRIGNAQLLRKCVWIALFVPGCSDDLQPAVSVKVVQVLQRRKRRPAWPAPGRPEVENDDLAAKRGKRDRSTIVVESPLRCCFANRRPECVLATHVTCRGSDIKVLCVESIELPYVSELEIGGAGRLLVSRAEDDATGQMILLRNRELESLLD